MKAFKVFTNNDRAIYLKDSIDINTKQLANEHEFDKSHTIETIKGNFKNFEPEVIKYVELCKAYFSQTDFSYLLKDGTKKNWDTKQERFEFMQKLDLTDICWDTVIWSTIKPTCTFTEVVGKLYKKLSVTTDRQGIETASEMVALLSKTPFITVVYPANAEEGVLMVKSNIKLDPKMKEYLANQRFTLPSLTVPKLVKCNTDNGYESIKGSIILSGNQHDKHLALDHINRMNSIALSLEPRVLLKAEPKFKAKGKESIKDTIKRAKAFEQNNTEGVDIYVKLINQDNEFYLTHQFDEIGRVYARGYHVNTMGDNYRKSMLVLANKEIIEMN